MRRRAIAVLLTVLVAACSTPASPPPPVSPGPSDGPTGATETATVLRVVDGDTIVVDRGQGRERVRYIGIDTPESVRPDHPVEWMGVEAAAANEALVAGRDVVLERDVSDTDRFGRLLRYVWLAEDGSWLLVNEALVAEGYAQVTTFPPDVKYADRFLDAQARARERGVGLWGPPPD
jgi:micrococcal nuclease